MDKYHYFGEFGYLNLEVFGGLEKYFEKNPRKVIEITTYENYGMLLKYLFPKNVKIKKLKWVQDKTRSGHSSNEKKKSPSLHELILNNKIKNNKRVISEDLFCIYLKKKIGKDSQNKSYISIFPRNRNICLHKNISETDWLKILKKIKKLDKRKIVLHGLGKEKINLKGDFIYPKNVLEQIYYLNNSVCCVCPDSGFAHFSLNCGCDTLVIGPSYWSFARYNPFKKKLFITSKEYFFESTILNRFIGNDSMTFREKMLMNHYKLLCVFRQFLWYPLRKLLLKRFPIFFEKIKKKYINRVSVNKKDEIN